MLAKSHSPIELWPRLLDERIMRKSLGARSLGQQRAGSALTRLFVVFTVALVVLGGLTKHRLHEIDQRIFHEALKDTFARVVVNEDWSSVASLGPSQNYNWLLQQNGTIGIAHGLGEISGQANSLPALRRSLLAGFKFFEVDLWLDSSGLHCFHGPGDPPSFSENDCTFDTLLAALPSDAWLILDIKTDFEPTGNRVVETLRRHGQANHVIFQLYKPEQFELFSRWQAVLPLPGPIVTAYVARRSANTIAAGAAHAGVHAFTLPLDRLNGFSNRPPGLAVFVHPIDDCASLERARGDGVRGVYMENNLGCPGEPSIARPTRSTPSHDD